MISQEKAERLLLGDYKMKEGKETVDIAFEKLVAELSKEAKNEKDREQKMFIERVQANISLWFAQWKEVRG